MLSKEILRDAFGWSWRVWSNAFIKALKHTDVFSRSGLRVLELGASPVSRVSILLDDVAENIFVSCFPHDLLQDTRSELNKVIIKHNLKSSYRTGCASIFEIEGTYDIIILKSVLGGAFPSNKFSQDEIFNYLSLELSSHLEKDGLIISIDNGRPVFDFFYRKLKVGSYKKSWNYICKKHIPDDFTCIGSGFFCKFDFKNRIPIIGVVLDFFLYKVDSFVFPVESNFSPAVVVSIFKKS